MRLEARHDHGVAVDPAVLRAVSRVLTDTAVDIRQTNLDVQADTLPAARAFDGFKTGKSLADLAEFWRQEYEYLAKETDGLALATESAAAAYAAADKSAAVSQSRGAGPWS